MRFFFITFAIVLADQAIKQLLLHGFGLPFWLIDQQLGLQVSLNQGIAFSLPLTGPAVIVIGAAVVVGIFWYFRNYMRRNWLTDLTFALIIGGALGNLLDRLWMGAVVDYLRIFSYPAFNLADAAITMGFLIFIFRFDKIRV